MSNALPVFESIARIGVAVLVNSLWQGALIAFATWLALRIFPKANASTRYAAWGLALAAVVVIPIATSLSRVTVAPTQPGATTSVVQTTMSSPAKTAQAPSHPSVTYSERNVTKTAEPPAKTPTPLLPSLRITVPTLAAAITFAAWLLAALAIVLRLAIAFVQLERLKQNALPLSIDYRDAMPRWQAAVKGERDVRICVSEAIDVPIAVGLFDSMILLPAGLVASLEAAEVDQISLHELAHLLRNDDWSNGLQRIAAALLFFNPAVWFISRQLDLEREVACDDYVLQLTGAVRPYAFCLTKMAEMTSWPHRPLPAPGVFVTRKNISVRIERLLRSGRAIGSKIAPSVATSVVVALAAVFLVLRTMTPSIAFTLPEPPQVATPPQPAAVAMKPSKPEPLAAPKVITKTIIVPEAPQARVAAATAEMPARVAQALKAAAPVIPERIAQAHHHLALHQEPPKTPELPSSVSVNVPLPNVSAILAQVQDGMTGRGCDGCDFEDAHLPGKDFSHRNLTGSNFAHADLKGARFDGSNLDGVNFSQADLRNASFVNARMEGCNLGGAQLAGAKFDGAALNGCNIDASNLEPAQARALMSSCTGCNFEGAHLAGMDLHGVRLQGTNLANADLRNVNFSNAELVGVNFAGATLNGARVDNASFTGCNFARVDLRNVDLSKASITGSNMRSAIMRD